MNNTQLRIQESTFSLKRFPSNQFDKSLRAWDAADEYIIDHVSNTLVLSELTHIVIVNDSFGALSCAMAKLAPQAKISVFTDSYMSMRAIEQNLKGSNLDKNKVSVYSSLRVHEHGEEVVDLVLLKLPRTLSYLDYLLQQLSETFAHVNTSSQSPIIVCGAMVKLVTSSAMKLFDDRMVNTTSSLARKKARLVFAQCSAQYNTKQSTKNSTTGSDGKKTTQDLATQTQCIHEVKDTEIDFTLYNYPNVFCREQVDIGARYMLKALPTIIKSDQIVIDLGCGNGILGTSVLLTNPKSVAKMIYVDESFMAIESAKATLKKSNINEQSKAKAEFIVGHCLESVINDIALDHTKRADIVLCNPPFHQQNTIIDDIAWQMFVDAKKVLKVGGELRIVGNRHLDHKAKLSKLFGSCKVVTNDSKFVVLSAVKSAS